MLQEYLSYIFKIILAPFLCLVHISAFLLIFSFPTCFFKIFIFREINVLALILSLIIGFFAFWVKRITDELLDKLYNFDFLKNIF